VRAGPVVTERLRLDPLSVDHAAAMVEVLADPSLYEFTGGSPPGLAELSDRYARQAVGRSPSGDQWWLNWVVTLDGAPVGYVQATVVSAVDVEAEVAWVLDPRHQGRGLATEAASAVVDWLATHGVDRLVAHIHPDHLASAGVAERLGLSPTDAVEDGEVRWVRTLG
jgi:RimJ/RimL family protein N-acetyltransferase